MSVGLLSKINDELERRKKNRFVIADYCFRQQLAFINDKSRFKTAVCSRRSGKTEVCVADLLNTAMTFSNVVCLYITLSRSNAKRLFWPKILRVINAFGLKVRLNETDLSIHFSNGSVIYLTGAKDKNEIEKFRGLDIKLVYIDEAQAFRSYIEELVNEVLAPALFDHNGTLCLIGTPGPVPVGYFYDSSQSSKWSNHAWTMRENPHIEIKSGKKIDELIAEELARMGVSIDDPRVQREFFGRWSIDHDSLVFKYDKIRNHYEEMPILPGKWEYVIGIDVGFDDADAIAVIGWHEKIKEAYLVEELVAKKQGISELADAISALIKKYNPLSTVMDTGGLGKKIAEELRKRHSLPIKAAEKSRKFEYIEILNDALISKRLFAKQNSRFAEDCILVEWDHEKTTPDRRVISDKYHSDITDAVLYSFREALHWLHVPEVPKPVSGSPEYFQKLQDDMYEHALEQQRIKQGFGDDVYHTEDWGMDESY